MRVKRWRQPYKRGNTKKDAWGDEQRVSVGYIGVNGKPQHESLPTIEPLDAVPLDAITGSVEDLREEGTDDELDAWMFEHDARKALKGLKSRISEDRFDILRLRYGLHGGAPFTLERLAEMHGVTRERIRQKQKEAENEPVFRNAMRAVWWWSGSNKLYARHMDRLRAEREEAHRKREIQQRINETTRKTREKWRRRNDRGSPGIPLTAEEMRRALRLSEYIVQQNFEREMERAMQRKEQRECTEERRRGAQNAGTNRSSTPTSSTPSARNAERQSTPRTTWLRMSDMMHSPAAQEMERLARWAQQEIDKRLWKDIEKLIEDGWKTEDLAIAHLANGGKAVGSKESNEILGPERHVTWEKTDEDHVKVTVK